MGTRRNIGGRYVEVRERSTSKGKRGTIMKNWKNKKNKRSKSINSNELLISIVIILLIIVLIYYFFF
jgi:hypothetical protein